MNVYVNLKAFNTGGSILNLQTDLVTWSGSNGGWKQHRAAKDKQYRRVKMTFRAYAAAPGSLATNWFLIQLLTQNIANQWAELSEFRLELGASVTAD